MFAPSLLSWGGGKLSNPVGGSVTNGGMLRSRQTINVKSKSAEVTVVGPVKEMHNSLTNSYIWFMHEQYSGRSILFDSTCAEVTVSETVIKKYM